MFTAINAILRHINRSSLGSAKRNKKDFQYGEWKVKHVLMSRDIRNKSQHKV